MSREGRRKAPEKRMKVARSLEKLGYTRSLLARDTQHVSEAKACSGPIPKYALDRSII